MSQPSDASNRRRTRRRASKSTVKVRCQKGTFGMGANVAQSLLEVSVDGARFVSSVPLECGQEITLSLEGPWHKRPLAAVACVRWCAELADGGYCVGVHFEKTLPYNEVQDIVSACG